MATGGVSRVFADWSYQGMTGVSMFDFATALDATGAQAAGNQAKQFFEGIRQYLHTDWSIQVRSTLEIYDIATSELTGEVTMGTPLSPTTGLLPTTDSYAGGVGACVRWKTNTIVFGHRAAGKTFLVPMSGIFQSDGTITQVAHDAILAAANLMVNKPNAQHAVWSKRYDRSTKPPTQTAGAINPILAAEVPDRAAGLRSRRS